MDYIDLVLCKGSTFLFQAPEFSMLNPEDKVIVNAKGNQQELTVQDVISISKNSDEFNFIVAMSGQSNPYKIIKKVTYQEFVYKDGDVNA